MAIDVGSVFVRLGGKLDKKGFDEFEQQKVRAQRLKDIAVRLGAEVDERDFIKFERKVEEAKAKASLRKAIKVSLGADYNGRAFDQWYRDMEKAKRQVKDTDSSVSKFTRTLTNLGQGSGRGFGPLGLIVGMLGNVAAAGAKAGESLGGAGGGLIGALGGLVGAAAAGTAALGSVLAVAVALGGALVALVGSLAAAAAGLAAIGVAAGAAFGPFLALGGAVIARVASLVEAYKALGNQQEKGGDQAKAAGQSQVGAAQQIKSAEQGVSDAQRNVKQAQEALTQARFKARREVQDLAAAVTHAAEAERGASLTLAGAQERLTQVNLDPKATLLDRLDAQHAVTDASQGVTDAHRTTARALQDRARGTDTVRQAQRQLDDAIRAETRAEEQVTQARRAATVATQKQGAAAVTAQEKLASLTATERKLLTTVRSFVETLSATFKPATDAIFGSLNTALTRLTPLVEGTKGRFKGLGDQVAGVIDRASKAFAGPEWQHAINVFFETASKLVKPLSDTVGSVLVILRNIAVAAQPYVVALADGMSRALGGLAAKTNDASRMSDIIRTLVDHTKSWARLTADVAKLFFAIFSSGAKDGKSLVDTLDRIVRRWTAFLNTDEGQRKMRQFFKDAVALTKDVIAILAKLVTALFDVGVWFQHALTHLKGVSDFVKEHTTLVKDLAKAWVAVKVATIAANTVAGGGAAANLLTGGLFAKGTAATTAERAATKAGPLRRFLAPAVAVGAGAYALSKVNTGDNFNSKKIGDAETSLEAFNHQLDRLYAFGDKAGADKIAASLHSLKPDDLKRVTQAAKDLADAGGTLEKTLNHALDQSAAHFRDFRRTGSNDLHGIHVATQDNMNFIKRTLGEDSAAGKEALARNFRLARTAIRQAMDDGKVSVKEGLAEIQRLMRKELAAYGITGGVASSIIKHGGNIGGSGGDRGGGGHATGGWIGMRGEAGGDHVPAILGRGEAVLNRHQQAIIEGLLGHGFLDQLFATVQRPHFLATGGFAGAQAAANQLERAHFPYLWGGGHQATPAPFGPMDCSGAVSYVLQHAGVNIPTSTSGQLMGLGRPGSGPLTVFANPVHTFMRLGRRFFGTSGQNPGGGAGFFDDPGAGYLARFVQRSFGSGGGGFSGAFARIRAPRVSGTGMLPAIVRAALGAAARGANRYADKRIGSFGTGTGDTGDPGPAVGGNARSVIRAALHLAGLPASGANIATELSLLSKENASGSPTAMNPISVGGQHATGFLQMLPSTFRSYAVKGHTNIRNAVDNAAASFRYQLARYGKLISFSPYGRGGFARRFAKGGFASGLGGKTGPFGPKFGGGSGAGTPDKLQVTRIAAYDKLETDVGDLVARYGQADRAYNLSDEILIDPATGALNEPAIKKRAGEIEALADIQRKIVTKYEQMRTIAHRIVATYVKLISRLTSSLKHVKGKRRSKIIGEISAYQEDLGTWRTNFHDIDVDKLPSARLDVLETLKEKADVLGTTAETPPADASAGAGADTGGGTTDTTPAAPTAADIAAGVAQEIGNSLSANVDIYRNFAPNFASAASAYGPGGMFNRPDVMTQAFGVRGFGATGGGGLGFGSGSPVVVVNDGGSFARFAQAPDDAPTFVSQVRFQVESAAG